LFKCQHQEKTKLCKTIPRGEVKGMRIPQAASVLQIQILTGRYMAKHPAVKKTEPKPGWGTLRVPVL